MPDKPVKLNLGRVPFDRAIEYLREKVDVGTKAYTDMMHGAHDTAFVVAGLTKGEILSDVHKLVNKAIQDGVPFDKFKKDFAKTIEGRWLPVDKRTGEANTGWRAKIIYQTNIRTAYAAGEFQQLQRLKTTLPYWRYRHGDSRKPREEHLAWDGLVLSADDPWWKTHFPPNGWGCRCYIQACDDIDLRELGKTGPDEAPPSPLRTVKHCDRMIEVPQGIDPGWAYTPGESVSPPPPSGQLLPDVTGPNAPMDGAAQARERQLERMPPDIARLVRAEISLSAGAPSEASGVRPAAPDAAKPAPENSPEGRHLAFRKPAEVSPEAQKFFKERVSFVLEGLADEIKYAPDFFEVGGIEDILRREIEKTPWLTEADKQECFERVRGADAATIAVAFVLPNEQMRPEFRLIAVNHLLADGRTVLEKGAADLYHAFDPPLPPNMLFDYWLCHEIDHIEKGASYMGDDGEGHSSSHGGDTLRRFLKLYPNLLDKHTVIKRR
jgi:SPP1 gp7 family putative phage head morphogenesis protein